MMDCKYQKIKKVGDAYSGSSNENDLANLKQFDGKKVKYELIGYHSLPGYLQDNEYILRHYRSEWPLKHILKSLFSVHNETGNVWTKTKMTRSSRRRSKYVSTTTKAFKIRPIAGIDGRSPWDTIGRYGMRNFILDKKSETLMSIGNDRASAACEAEKAAGNWHITSYWP